MDRRFLAIVVAGALLMFGAVWFWTAPGEQAAPAIAAEHEPQGAVWPPPATSSSAAAPAPAPASSPPAETVAAPSYTDDRPPPPGSTAKLR